MFEEAIHQRLRRVRIARGESLASFALRHGIRIEFLRAIEEGRFQDLPTGIYARAAVRAYASALRLNPEEILAICAPLLPSIEDPIAAMARLRGVPVPRRRPTWRNDTESESAATNNRAPRTSDGTPSTLPSWRLIAASAIDATVMAAMLLAVVTCTVAMGVPVSALGGPSAPAFLILTFVLSGCYFLVLGGIVGATAGEYLTGVGGKVAEPKPLDLRTLSGRAVQSVLRDVYFIERLGLWIGRVTANHKWPKDESLIAVLGSRIQRFTMSDQ